MSAQEGNECADTDPHPQVTQEKEWRKGLRFPQGSRDEWQGKVGGSCAPSGKVVKGKALPDLLEGETY